MTFTVPLYPAINRELLISGAILHDVAKTFEMNVSKSGLCDGYTVGGELIGHLVKGAMYVEESAKKLPLSVILAARSSMQDLRIL